MMEILI